MMVRLRDVRVEYNGAMSRPLRLGALAAFVCLLQAPAWAQVPLAPSPNPAAAPPTASASVTDSDYVLGHGDKVRVIVYDEPTLSGEFFVSPTGKVSMPLVGDVNAADLTLSQFQQGVTEALRGGYLKEPRVSAEVLTYRPFYILGEVNKPGEYPYTSGLTVLNAVATAGGFTYRAQTRKVFIRRRGAAREESYALAPETKVAPGDTVRIAERFF